MHGGLLGRWWEKAACLLALASVWPWLLRWPHPFWGILMYTMLGVLGVFFVGNVVRLWRLGHPHPPE